MTSMMDVAHRGPYLLPESLSAASGALTTFGGSDETRLRDGHGAGQAQTGEPIA